MFKSVFTKYVTAFMVIIVISFSILAGIISAQTVKYSVETKRDTLYNTANYIKIKLEDEISTTLAALNDENAADDFSFTEYINTADNKRNISRDISTLARYTKSMVIMVTDAEGRLLVTDDYTDPGTFLTHKVDAEVMGNIGGAQSYQAETTLGGMFAGRTVTSDPTS
jgi:hypothetical protein